MLASFSIHDFLALRQMKSFSNQTKPTNLIPPVSVSHDASQRSCDFAQDIFGKAASSDASEPGGGVAMASQFASLQPVT